MSIKHPRLELKSFKYSAFASHETDCFEATLYLDGKRLAIVSNSGQGGCTEVHPFGKKPYQEALAPLSEYIKTLPPVEFGFAPGTFDPDIDYVISELVEEKLVEKDVKKYAKKATILDADGKTLRSWGVRSNAKAWLTLHREKIERDYPGCFIFALNSVEDGVRALLDGQAKLRAEERAKNNRFNSHEVYYNGLDNCIGVVLNVDWSEEQITAAVKEEFERQGIDFKSVDITISSDGFGFFKDKGGDTLHLSV